MMLRIGEVAQQVGVATSTLRYYEEIGLLPPPQRVNGQRRYDPSVLDRLRLIQMAQAGGLRLEAIARLLDGFPAHTPPSERWQALVPPTLAALDQQIQHLQQMKAILAQTLTCQCETLAGCTQAVANERP